MKKYILPLAGLAIGTGMAVYFKNDPVDPKSGQDIHLGNIGKGFIVVSSLLLAYKVLVKND